MKVFALCGESDSGKTSALKLLTAKLLKDKEAQLLYCFYRHSLSQIVDPDNPAWSTPHGNVRNVTAVFSWHGKRIVVTTVGDAPSMIQCAVLGALKRAEIDISDIDGIVCACHPCMKVETFFPGVQRADVVTIPKPSTALCGTRKISPADSTVCRELLQQLKNL